MAAEKNRQKKRKTTNSMSFAFIVFFLALYTEFVHFPFKKFCAKYAFKYLMINFL